MEFVLLMKIIIQFFEKENKIEKLINLKSFNLKKSLDK